MGIFPLTLLLLWICVVGRIHGLDLSECQAFSVVMHFTFAQQTDWPAGAWLAQAAADSSEVLVWHGSGVSTHGDWFGEIVWDSDYSNAGFDQTDLVYGSGGKLDGGGVRFVSSGTTMDRLLHTKCGQRWMVSNSLVCLMAATGDRLDPLDGRYRAFFSSIIHGLDDHQSSLLTSGGPVHLTYVDHVRVEAGRVHLIAAPIQQRQLTSYGAYRGFLEEALRRIADNMRSPMRPTRYDYLGTVSTGFDSPTVAALARPAGLEEVLTFSSARGGADDDGSKIAEHLGLRVNALDRGAWQQADLPEPVFLAADAKGEDVYFTGAADHLLGKVLLTGYAAGAWAATPHANPSLRRADQSGLSLAEYRLEAGFLHLPVPTMGVRGIGDNEFRAISADLGTWASGKSYDKPFCRRVLTEAGVPAELFGQEKKAASVLVFDRRSLLSARSKPDFFRHLEQARRQRPLRAAKAVARGLAMRAVAGCALAARRTAGIIGPLLRVGLLQRLADSERLKEWAYYEPLSEHLFPWAMSHAVKRYDAPAEASERRGAEHADQE